MSNVLCRVLAALVQIRGADSSVRPATNHIASACLHRLSRSQLISPLPALPQRSRRDAQSRQMGCAEKIVRLPVRAGGESSESSWEPKVSTSSSVPSSLKASSAHKARGRGVSACPCVHASELLCRERVSVSVARVAQDCAYFSSVINLYVEHLKQAQPLSPSS